jgi:hypothetical protein
LVNRRDGYHYLHMVPPPQFLPGFQLFTMAVLPINGDSISGSLSNHANYLQACSDLYKEKEGDDSYFCPVGYVIFLFLLIRSEHTCNYKVWQWLWNIVSKYPQHNLCHSHSYPDFTRCGINNSRSIFFPYIFVYIFQQFSMSEFIDEWLLALTGNTTSFALITLRQ